MTADAHLANRLLGYPPEARLLIVNADDFGMCHSQNDATRRSLLDGVATSATLMTPCPWALHAMQILKEHPDLSFGVHLTLVSEIGNYRWGPLSPRSSVPSLIDESGYFFRYERIPELLARADIREVETEFRAQIGAVLAAGLAPTHLDWHCLADGRRPDIFELTFRLAREHGLALRVHGRDSAARCREFGLPIVDHDVLDSYHLDPAEKAARFAQLLRDLPSGLTEWAVHPSAGYPEAQALEPETWRIRRADLDFLVSQDAREIVADEGIVLLSYRDLQPFWSREPAAGA